MSGSQPKPLTLYFTFLPFFLTKDMLGKPAKAVWARGRFVRQAIWSRQAPKLGLQINLVENKSSQYSEDTMELFCSCFPNRNGHLWPLGTSALIRSNHSGDGSLSNPAFHMFLKRRAGGWQLDVFNLVVFHVAF